MTLRALALVLLAMVAFGCARSKAASAPGAAARNPIDVYFPLVDGTIYTYQLEGGDAFMVRVKRLGPDSAQLLTGDSLKALSVTATAVRREPAGTLLQMPLEVGAFWQGPHGAVRIVDNRAQVKVPAGTFSDCVQTREEVGGDARGTIDTWFCPDVGITRMTVEEWQGDHSVSQLTVLRSFGPPVDLQK